MRIEPLRYFGGAISTASCWGAVACGALFVLRPRVLDAAPRREVLFWDCVSLLLRDAEPRRRVLFVAFFSCAILRDYSLFIEVLPYSYGSDSWNRPAVHGETRGIASQQSGG